MASTSETGHAKNVANFEDMVSFVTGYGVTYNPSKAAIKLPALNTLLTNAKNSLTATNSAVIPFNNAVNARDIAFAPLSKLITRVFAALDATDASKQVVADAKTIARKLQGKRASDKITPVADNPATPVDESAKSISASQMSFDSRIENFSKLITLLTCEPLYVPNEIDVKVATLNTLLASLKTVNTAVINVYVFKPIWTFHVKKLNVSFQTKVY